MKPPIIATKYCRSLLGCEECVIIWYNGVHGLGKKCLHCNEPRGYAFTFQFKGLDDFIREMRKRDMRKIINFLNDPQIKNNSASLHRWLSLCYQRIKQLNTVVGVYLLIEEHACILKAPCLAKKQ